MCCLRSSSANVDPRPKGAADTLDIYRPISVLPTAYKIVTKALAMRLAGLMSVIVPPNQTGFIKGRDIRTNILKAHLAKAFLADYKVVRQSTIIVFKGGKEIARLSYDSDPARIEQTLARANS